MTDLTNVALDSFFRFYRNDVATEEIDEHNVVLSFPVHFVGFHRIEITVTSVGPERFILSDGAKVVDELRLAGYKLSTKLRGRIEQVSKAARLRVVNSNLLTECSLTDLGVTIQRFLEAAKTIGDAYLVQRVAIKSELDIANVVTSFLTEHGVIYQPRHSLPGEYEPHKIDFYIPPNGVPGLALSVLNNPTRTTPRLGLSALQTLSV